MIGVLLHLAALAPAAVATHVASAALSLLGRGTPDPSEVDQLGAECDALRAERDLARAQREEWKQNAVDAARRDLEHLIERDDARTLAHEAKLEFSAAREACEQLRGELADWRGIAASEQREAAEVRAQLEELRGLALNAIESRERLKVANGGGVATDSEAMVIRVDCQDAWAALVKAVKP